MDSFCIISNDFQINLLLPFLVEIYFACSCVLLLNFVCQSVYGFCLQSSVSMTIACLSSPGKSYVLRKGCYSIQSFQRLLVLIVLRPVYGQSMGLKEVHLHVMYLVIHISVGILSFMVSGTFITQLPLYNDFTHVICQVTQLPVKEREKRKRRALCQSHVFTRCYFRRVRRFFRRALATTILPKIRTHVPHKVYIVVLAYPVPLSEAHKTTPKVVTCS